MSRRTPGLAPGWRPALRIAWRDVRRSRGRTALTLVMVALPVLGVVATDVIVTTQDVSGAESLDRRLGAADALVRTEPGTTKVEQGPDPESGFSSAGPGGGRGADLADVRRVLGADVPVAPVGTGYRRLASDDGVLGAEAQVLDLSDPLTEGLFTVDDGRLPNADDEVVVNQEAAERGGWSVGDTLQVDDGDAYTVVGIGESAGYRGSPVLAGSDEALLGPAEGVGSARSWLVGGGDVTWEEVRALNGAGAFVLSRAVLEDPPPDSELPAAVSEMGGASVDDATMAVAVLVVVMALLQVVLLAGPAFAVGARRQSRTLALLAASGGTPVQARRVVLASGVVLGSLAAGIGVALGLVVAAVALPVLQHFSDSWFGPFDVRWLHVAGIALFGLLSALLAAVVPAWIASRQDVVAVLAGRRGDRAPSLRSPLLGVVLLGAGMAGSAFGAVAQEGEFFIAASALPTVLGMVLLVPLVVTAVSRLGRWLPLALRYAVRDAARQRTRTVPAVAAVAATVSGVVALGIANASDAEQAEAMYTPRLASGAAIITAYGEGHDKWPQLRAAAERVLPGQDPQEVRGVQEQLADFAYREVRVRAVPGPGSVLSMYIGSAGSALLVAEELPAPVALGLSAADAERADAALADGRAVVLTDADAEVATDRARVVLVEHGERGEPRRGPPATVPAEFVPIKGNEGMAQAVLPPGLAEDAGLPVGPVALLLGELSDDQEDALQEAVSGITPDASVYVERGARTSEQGVILLLVLAGLGGVLMLGGTLTATLLALSDARPDLATLAAVGAAPRTRRAVAAAYALVVGLVGAVLGAAIGFVPGIAATYPLTGERWGMTVTADGTPLPDHFLDIPWLLVLGIVVLLPLLVAGVVGLTARSRLPVTSRLA